MDKQVQQQFINIVVYDVEFLNIIINETTRAIHATKPYILDCLQGIIYIIIN
jgi:hypothetical protein